MRLFMSYARVDKPYCQQIVDVLDVHDVWYDQRLHAGQQWWDEIQYRLEWCEGLVYLMSPDSIASEYCQKELEIATEGGKHIFPVLIHSRVKLPENIQHIQYADFSHGITSESVKLLLNSIYIAERETIQRSTHHRVTASTPKISSVETLPSTDPDNLIEEIAVAMDEKQFDRAVFLLKQVKNNGYKLRFVNLEAMLHEAEAALEHQAYLREAKREYTSILALVRHKKTRQMGCEAFLQFRAHFPDYDPKNIASVCNATIMPMLEWCDIPSGDVTVEYGEKSVTYHIDSFKMSRYPITNSQFQIFANDEEGYKNPKWWQFSSEAQTWYESHPNPLRSRFAWGDHPRSNICLYEAIAFCNWLSYKLNKQVFLPSEQQWQRAAQGDDNRTYPWGNDYDKLRCNTKETKQRMTTSVKKYDKRGDSPFGVADMAGNVWEWCDSVDYAHRHFVHDYSIARAVRGGAFLSVAQRARNTFHFFLNPTYRYASIGFRVITAKDK